MLNDFDTADLLSSRRDDVTPEDERTVSDLMVDQIEFADVIILNKIDMVSIQSVFRMVPGLTSCTDKWRDERGGQEFGQETQPPRQNH